MATLQSVDITAKFERRLCQVKDELGYFHCWEHFSQPVPAGLTIGSPPAGVISYVSGIVEFADGVERVDPTDIRFCDEENHMLHVMDAHRKDN